MLEAIAALGLWAALLVTLIIIGFMVVVETRSHFLAFLLTIGLLVAWSWNVGFYETWVYLSSNVGTIIGYGVAWLIAGLIWSLFKWDRFVAARAKYCRTNAPKAAPPEWSNYKSMLGAWVLWWPFSMLAYVIGDLLMDALNWAVSLLGRIYDAITKRHFPVGKDTN